MMIRHKIPGWMGYRVVVLLAGLAFWAPRVAAAGPFSLSSRVLQLEEVGAVTNWVLSVSQGRFAFMVPRRWRVEANAASQRVVLSSPAGDQILIRLEDDNPAAKARFDVPELKRAITERFAGSQVVADGVCFTEAEAGITFDVRLKPSDADAQRMRMAFVRVGSAPFSFTLNASAKRFPGVMPVFTDLLTSFQVLDGRR